MLERILGIAATVLVASFVLLPILILGLYGFSERWTTPDILPSAFTLEWFRYLLTYENGLPSLLLSVEVALVTTALAVIAGVPAGYALARYDFPAKALIELLLLAKTAVPVIVVGVGMASLFVRLGLTDSFTGLVLAHLAGALPLVIWTAAAAFRNVDLRLEEAARDAGAGFMRIFIEIAVPLAGSGILAGAILAFLFSMDEFTITFLISGAEYSTLPLRLYSTLQQGYIEPASAAALMLLTPSLLFVALLMRFVRPAELGRGLGHGG
jgi:ABC-type spermidine/putrescine transport system permease subunit II